MSAGFLNRSTTHSAKVIEISTKDNTEVFEGTIYMKDLNTGGKSGWGHADVLYRSKRMPLRYQLGTSTLSCWLNLAFTETTKIS